MKNIPKDLLSKNSWKSHLIFAVLSVMTLPAWALLAVDDVAPEIISPAALAGKSQTFDLKEQLKKGPVVLYFFPKAYTQGCTVEAHLFAENTQKFKQLGATVVGVSHDDIDTLKSFSKESCRNQFMVVSDPQRQAIKAYDAQFWWLPITKRVTYIITPNQKIMYVYSDLSPSEHIQKTLTALKNWQNLPNSNVK